MKPTGTPDVPPSAGGTLSGGDHEAPGRVSGPGRDGDPREGLPGAPGHAGVDPRRKDAPDLFKRCTNDWGMKGLKLHPCAGFYPNQKEVYPLLEQACELKIPVLIHSGSMMVPLRSKYSQAIHFDDLAADFPDLPVIAAHSGGLFGYTQMISIMNVKLNIMADI